LIVHEKQGNFSGLWAFDGGYTLLI